MLNFKQVAASQRYEGLPGEGAVRTVVPPGRNVGRAPVAHHQLRARPLVVVTLEGHLDVAQLIG